MKILLVYPEFPVTFWSFKYALNFISKKANNPPLGLITVAALLPGVWDKKLVDMNVSRLTNKHLEWADYVLISAMSVQKESAVQIINRCITYNKKIIAGGPLFTEHPEQFPEVDHLILNEAEVTLPRFLEDMEKGDPKRIYSSSVFPDIKKSPVPLFSLLELNKYNSMSIQFSRGCPYDCEFCEITQLFGRKVRLKNTSQIIAELDNLHKANWRGGVFFVDDNFIGNRTFLKKDLLPAMDAWMKSVNFPFTFSTEASINIADDQVLLDQMCRTGFNMVFIGIETVEEESLAECNKHQNKNRDMLESVKEIQRHGIEVTGGFIVGFDSDSPSIFQRQIDFIQKSGIVTAMVGLLNAPPKTRLYHRLKGENRLIDDFGGDNTNYSMNFIPKMKMKDLMEGYKKILAGIYSHKPYYDRVKENLKSYQIKKTKAGIFKFNRIKAFIKSVFIIGIFNKGRRQYWKLLLWSIFSMPRKFGMAITYAIYGYHFRKVFQIK